MGLPACRLHQAEGQADYSVGPGDKWLHRFTERGKEIEKIRDFYRRSVSHAEVVSAARAGSVCRAFGDARRTWSSVLLRCGRQVSSANRWIAKALSRASDHATSFR